MTVSELSMGIYSPLSLSGEAKTFVGGIAANSCKCNARQKWQSTRKFICV